MRTRKNIKYYVVIKGRNVGVFDNWPECEEQILCYRNAFYKKVESLYKAMGYVYEHMMMSDGPYFIRVGRFREMYQDFYMFLEHLEGLAKMNN